MVFQYNPLENYIEINDRGEAVVTLNNSSVLSPKLRYNVGDEGLTMSRRDVLERLTALGVVETRQQLPRSWGAPFFFLYGRRDGTISYMGANIYPIDVEYGLYRDEELAAAIESFCLELDESPALESRPVVHVQLRKGARMDTTVVGRAAASRPRRLSRLAEPRLRGVAEGGSIGGRHPPRCSTSTPPARSPTPARRSRTSTSSGAREDR